MLTTVHQFYAMGSDCAVHLCVETAADFEQIAGAAEAEIRRLSVAIRAIATIVN
jgi:hypothetical protein